MNTVSEYISVMPQLNNPESAASECLGAMGAIESQLNFEDKLPIRTLNQLTVLQHSLKNVTSGLTILSEKTISELEGEAYLLINTFKEEVETKLNVVFFPYKASMWDSLATVYEAAANDAKCIAHVVPIPYYKLTQDEAVPVYEGDQFPKDVPITHYSNYILEEQQPDIIFVHNIYDKYNTLTRVHEHYFTTNLKKYTDMLVYVPYHISSFIPPEGERLSLAYNTPTINNVDKVILVGEFLKNAAIRDGISEQKILALGSPKFDSLVNSLNNGCDYPPEWQAKMEGKTVYLINTGCLYFSEQPFIRLERFLDFLNIPRIANDSVVIWRPHPLTMVSILKYSPQFAEYYYNLTEKYIKGGDSFYSHIILDETDDYIPALMAADVLISSDGSLLRSYLLTEKKVLFWDEGLPKESLLPPDVFYFAFNRSEPWYELVKKFSNGYDPLRKNRKDMAAKVYANTDGTCGIKVFEAVKECVLKGNEYYFGD